MKSSTATRDTAINEAILLVTQGHSANQAAKQVAAGLEVSARSIQRWAQEAGTPLGVIAHDTAKTARLVQNAEFEARRAAFRVELFTKCRELLIRMDAPHVDFRGKDARMVTFPVATSSDVRNYAVAVGILLDKTRLEEGKATGRIESVPIDEATRVMREWVESVEADANAG